MEMNEKTLWRLTDEDVWKILYSMWVDGKDLNLTEEEKEDICRDISDHFGINWYEEVEDLLYNNIIVKHKIRGRKNANC